MYNEEIANEKRLRSCMNDSLPVFAYWHSEDQGLLAGFLADWGTHFPDLRVISDANVEPLIGHILPSYVELYRRIRFPATKADIARLAYLHEFGGLYVDCHCGLRSAKGVRELVEQLSRYELVMWENSYITWPRPKNTMKVINGILLASPRSSIVLEFLLKGLANLEAHSKREASEGMVEYSPWYLCGAGSYLEHLCVPGSANTQLRSEFGGRIFFTELDDGTDSYQSARWLQIGPETALELSAPPRAAVRSRRQRFNR
jgi:Glycosyltransferase sugar-binding region containing DXD motif